MHTDDGGDMPITIVVRVGNRQRSLIPHDEAARWVADAARGCWVSGPGPMHKAALNQQGEEHHDD